VLDHYLRPVFTGGVDELVRDVLRRLGNADSADHVVDRVAVVDGAGILVADLSMLELSTVSPDRPLSQLLSHVSVPAVPIDEELSEAVWALLEARQGSIVVVNREGRPIGRLFATDVVRAFQRHRRLLRALHARSVPRAG
jgi:CBS domain-containing protein